MNRFSWTAMVFGAMALLASCQKDEALSAGEQEITQETLARIADLGFGTDKVERHDDGYLVEGDIVLTEQMLNSSPDRKTLRIAEVEQYHTFNLVNGLPRTITLSASGRKVPESLTNAIQDAAARYNDENLGITFQYIGNKGGGDINVKLTKTRQYIASAGFPSGGDPYPTVNYSSGYTSYSAGFMATVLAHEIGHCIGFRHTDYMNRAYSCGSGGNEGQATSGVGAVLIPGTPSGPDAGSWMLACLSASTNRPFNTNDKKALDYLY